MTSLTNLTLLHPLTVTSTSYITLPVASSEYSFEDDSHRINQLSNPKVQINNGKVGLLAIFDDRIEESKNNYLKNGKLRRRLLRKKRSVQEINRIDSVTRNLNSFKTIQSFKGDNNEPNVLNLNNFDDQEEQTNVNSQYSIHQKNSNLDSISTQEDSKDLPQNQQKIKQQQRARYSFHQGHKNKKPVYVQINQQTVNALLYLLLLFIISTCGCMGNIFIISALTVIESLQTRGNCFLVSLALAHLLVNLFVIPSSAIQIMAGDGINSKSLCHYQWLTLEFSLIVSQLSFFLMAADNYLSFKLSEKVTTSVEMASRVLQQANNSLVDQTGSLYHNNNPQPLSNSTSNYLGILSHPLQSTPTQVTNNTTKKATLIVPGQTLGSSPASSNTLLQTTKDASKATCPPNPTLTSDVDRQLMSKQSLANELAKSYPLANSNNQANNNNNNFLNSLCSSLWNYISSCRCFCFLLTRNKSTLKNIKRQNKMRLANHFVNQQEAKFERRSLFSYRNLCGNLKVLVWILLIWLVAFLYTYHQHNFSYNPKFCLSLPSPGIPPPMGPSAQTLTFPTPSSFNAFSDDSKNIMAKQRPNRDLKEHSQLLEEIQQSSPINTLHLQESEAKINLTSSGQLERRPFRAKLIEWDTWRPKEEGIKSTLGWHKVLANGSHLANPASSLLSSQKQAKSSLGSLDLAPTKKVWLDQRKLAENAPNSAPKTGLLSSSLSNSKPWTLGGSILSKPARNLIEFFDYSTENPLAISGITTKSGTKREKQGKFGDVFEEKIAKESEAKKDDGLFESNLNYPQRDVLRPEERSSQLTPSVGRSAGFSINSFQALYEKQKEEQELGEPMFVVGDLKMKRKEEKVHDKRNNKLPPARETKGDEHDEEAQLEVDNEKLVTSVVGGKESAGSSWKHHSDSCHRNKAASLEFVETQTTSSLSANGQNKSQYHRLTSEQTSLPTNSAILNENRTHLEQLAKADSLEYNQNNDSYTRVSPSLALNLLVLESSLLSSSSSSSWSPLNSSILLVNNISKASKNRVEFNDNNLETFSTLNLPNDKRHLDTLKSNTKSITIEDPSKRVVSNDGLHDLRKLDLVKDDSSTKVILGPTSNIKEDTKQHDIYKEVGLFHQSEFEDQRAKDRWPILLTSEEDDMKVSSTSEPSKLISKYSGFQEADSRGPGAREKVFMVESKSSGKFVESAGDDYFRFDLPKEAETFFSPTFSSSSLVSQSKLELEKLKLMNNNNNNNNDNKDDRGMQIIKKHPQGLLYVLDNNDGNDDDDDDGDGEELSSEVSHRTKETGEDVIEGKDAAPGNVWTYLSDKQAPSLLAVDHLNVPGKSGNSASVPRGTLAIQRTALVKMEGKQDNKGSVEFADPGLSHKNIRKFKKDVLTTSTANLVKRDVTILKEHSNLESFLHSSSFSSPSSFSNNQYQSILNNNTSQINLSTSSIEHGNNRESKLGNRLYGDGGKPEDGLEILHEITNRQAVASERSSKLPPNYWLALFSCLVAPSFGSIILFTLSYMKMKQFKLRQSNLIPSSIFQDYPTLFLQGTYNQPAIQLPSYPVQQNPQSQPQRLYASSSSSTSLQVISSIHHQATLTSPAKQNPSPVLEQRDEEVSSSSTNIHHQTNRAKASSSEEAKTSQDSNSSCEENEEGGLIDKLTKDQQDSSPLIHTSQALVKINSRAQNQSQLQSGSSFKCKTNAKRSNFLTAPVDFSTDRRSASQPTGNTNNFFPLEPNQPFSDDGDTHRNIIETPPSVCFQSLSQKQLSPSVFTSTECTSKPHLALNQAYSAPIGYQANNYLTTNANQHFSMGPHQPTLPEPTTNNHHHHHLYINTSSNNNSHRLNPNEYQFVRAKASSFNTHTGAGYINGEYRGNYYDLNIKRNQSFSAPPSATFYNHRGAEEVFFNVSPSKPMINLFKQQQQQQQQQNDSPVGYQQLRQVGNEQQASQQQYEFRRSQIHAQSFHYGCSVANVRQQQQSFAGAIYSLKSNPSGEQTCSLSSQLKGSYSRCLESASFQVAPINGQEQQHLSPGAIQIEQQHLLERHRSLPHSSKLASIVGSSENRSEYPRLTNGRSRRHRKSIKKSPREPASLIDGRGEEEEQKEAEEEQEEGQALLFGGQDRKTTKSLKEVIKSSSSIECEHSDTNVVQQQTNSTMREDKETIEVKLSSTNGLVGQQLPAELKNTNKESKETREGEKKVVLCTYSYMTDEQLLKSNIRVFVVNLILWLPFVMVSVVNQFQDQLTQELKDTIWWLATLNCCSCSYIYAITNKDFREAFNKLFYYCCCKSHVTFQKKTLIYRRQMDIDSKGNLRIHIIPGLNVCSNKLGALTSATNTDTSARFTLANSTTNLPNTNLGSSSTTTTTTTTNQANSSHTHHHHQHSSLNPAFAAFKTQVSSRRVEYSRTGHRSSTKINHHVGFNKPLGSLKDHHQQSFDNNSRGFHNSATSRRYNRSIKVNYNQV